MGNGLDLQPAISKISAKGKAKTETFVKRALQNNGKPRQTKVARDLHVSSQQVRKEKPGLQGSAHQDEHLREMSAMAGGVSSPRPGMRAVAVHDIDLKVVKSCC